MNENTLESKAIPPYSIWAIADPHLSFGTPNKKMDIFGKHWIGWTKKIEDNWRAAILPQDLVLIAGDISWAMTIDQVIPDLMWIDSLPGTKIILRGNHDYWWESRSKIEKVLPSSIKIIQNDAIQWQDISIGGARLWDSSEYNFGGSIQVEGDRQSKAPLPSDEEKENAEKIFVRELGRLEKSLKMLNPNAACRIALTHYPPIGLDLMPSRASLLLEKYHVNICLFGHLHSVKRGSSLFGEKRGVKYYLTSCDYLDFFPIKIYN